LRPLATRRHVFFDQPAAFSVRLIVEVGISARNLSHRKTAISSRYRSGFSRRCSQRASSIIGVTDRGRPPPFHGALTDPKARRLERMYLTARTLQPAASAICAAVSLLSYSRSCRESSGAVKTPDVGPSLVYRRLEQFGVVVSEWRGRVGGRQACKPSARTARLSPAELQLILGRRHHRLRRLLLYHDLRNLFWRRECRFASGHRQRPGEHYVPPGTR